VTADMGSMEPLALTINASAARMGARDGGSRVGLVHAGRYLVLLLDAG